MIKIDGSYGEGGGQVLRTALSLSACLKTPFELINIRKGRKNPGLFPQHLTCVNAVKKICNAETEGAFLGSTRLVFQPNEIRPGDYDFNVAETKGSAGATTLVAQAILPILLSTKSKVTIRGGTHVPFSPIFDYLDEVLIGYLNRVGKIVNAKLWQYGFYPVGQGKITLEFFGNPNWKNLSVVNTRGALRKLILVSKVAKLPISIAERQKNQFVKLLQNDFPQMPIDTKVEAVDARCPGSYLFLKAEFDHITVGFSSLGAKGKMAETVAIEVYQEFKDYWLNTDSVYDYHLADQICIFLALSRFFSQDRSSPFIIKTNKLTGHLQTNIWLIKQFIPGFQPLISANG
ncbi:MAG: RNA 3'-terminal phosphate cyclase [candidate division WOR-3 bacterium]|nr:RNA 3'-terminal phosphate cyclase [candidate division WOR-3 bacterium]